MRFNGRATTDAQELTALVAADGTSGGFIKDSQATAAGLSVLGAADAAAQMALLPGARVLYRLTGANMNVTTDQAFTKVGTFSTFLAIRILAVNPSISLTTAVGGIYDAAAKGGNAWVASSQVYSQADMTTGRGQALTFNNPVTGLVSAPALAYLSLTTPQGAAATADFYIIGAPVA